MKVKWKNPVSAFSPLCSAMHATSVVSCRLQDGRTALTVDIQVGQAGSVPKMAAQPAPLKAPKLHWWQLF